MRIQLSEDVPHVATSGMGPCVGVLVYDHRSKVAYGCHYPSPHDVEKDDLLNMLLKAFGEFRKSPRVSVFVGGCCEEDPSGAKEHDELGQMQGHDPLTVRTIVERAIKRMVKTSGGKGWRGRIKTHFKWPPKQVWGMKLSLSRKTGKCKRVDLNVGGKSTNGSIERA